MFMMQMWPSIGVPYLDTPWPTKRRSNDDEGIDEDDGPQDIDFQVSRLDPRDFEEGETPESSFDLELYGAPCLLRFILFY